MKIIILITFCLLVSFSSFGQQFLWSTTADTTLKWGKFIDLKNVENKILDFYDHYDYHYDGSGYSKSGFIKSFENSASFNNTNQNIWKAFKKEIYEINSLTLFAFKSNSGSGSSILVICISKENVDMITFSNDIEEGVRLTHSSEKEKFRTWLKTFIN